MGLNTTLATLLTVTLFQVADSEVIVTLQDAKNAPIAGVTCAQNGGPTGTSDNAGKLTLNGLVNSIYKSNPNSQQNFSLSQIPLAFGERATVTILNTKGQKVFNQSIKLGEHVAFSQQNKGLYFITITTPKESFKRRFVNTGSGLVFEGMATQNTLAKTAAISASIVCSKTGYVTQVYQIVEGTNLTVDFSTPKIIPLFSGNTKLNRLVREDIGTAIVTRWGDRARDRHSRENNFQSHDHYLPHYWELRTARYIITDHVAKGGHTMEVSWVTEWKLDQLPEFRAWYSGRGSEAQYYGNYAPRFTKLGVGTYDENHNKISDQGHQWKYIYTIETSIGLDGKESPLAVGQFMEIEASQFLDFTMPNPPVGRDNYYGTVFLYEVGVGGMVPWDTVGVWENQASERENSHKMDEATWLGGRTTLHKQISDEPDKNFMQMATNIDGENAQPFVLGRRVLHTNFITGAHDEPENPIWEENAGKGGPNYINTSCNQCHIRNGRGTTPVVGGPLYNMVVKVGDANGNPHPKLGGVLQPQNTAGNSEGEGKILSWVESNGLRKANYGFTGVTPINYSVRTTPQLVGMGLLEAIPETAIQALEDPNDANGDGISGRINIVNDPVTSQPRMGRFGWKAGKVDVKHQIAGAFNTDMGVMTSLLPKPDCGSEETNCGATGTELADSSLSHLVDYISLLGIRARRDYKDPVALQGEALFTSMGCVACHIPTLKTSAFAPKAELRDQTIHPYTDLLLHDMGAGLADNLPEGQATGAEWRTPPLWGIGNSPCATGGVVGLIQKQTCKPDANYLHDARARTLEEAILWHGGEGAAAAAKFKALSTGESAAVVKFLNSL